MTHVRAAAAACLLTLVLGGCGDDEDAPATTPPSSSTGTDGLTAPGSTLDLGDRATLPLADEAGVIDLVVTAIEAGDPEDLGELEGTPYHVRLEATAVLGDASRFFPAGSVVAFAGETLVAPVATPLTVGSCTREQFRSPPPPGASLETCLTFVVEPGDPAIDRVAYYEGAYSFNDGTAVEWR